MSLKHTKALLQAQELVWLGIHMLLLGPTDAGHGLEKQCWSMLLGQQAAKKIQRCHGSI